MSDEALGGFVVSQKVSTCVEKCPKVSESVERFFVDFSCFWPCAKNNSKLSKLVLTLFSDF